MKRVKVDGTAWMFDRTEQEELRRLLELARSVLCDHSVIAVELIAKVAHSKYIKTADSMIAQLERSDAG